MAQLKVGARLGESFGTLKARGFRNLFLGNLCLNFALWFQMIGLGWLVYQLTGSAAQMGGITATQGLVLLVTSPIAGILSDRINRRRLLLATSAVAGVQALTLAVLVGTGLAQVWHLYVYAIIGGTANAMGQTVRQAFVFDVVGREGVARAVPINNLSQSGARVLGPAVAGAVIGFTGTANVFYVQGALMLLGMVFTVLIGPTSQVTSRAKESPIRTLIEGFRYSAGNPAIFGQLCTAVIPTLLVYPYVGFLAFFSGQLDLGAQGYGIMATGAGYGGVIGLLFLTVIGEVKRKGRLLLLAQGLYPCTVALFTLTDNLWMAMVCLVGAGFTNGLYMAMQNTLLLLSSREDMRGRVMSLYTMVSGLGPIGSFSLGLAISRWGPNDAVLAYQIAAIALVALSALTFKAVREA